MPSTSHDTPTSATKKKVGYRRLLKELSFEHFHDENVGDGVGEDGHSHVCVRRTCVVMM